MQDDHPIAEGLEAVNLATEDPRLVRWAEGTATAEDRAALEREASTDAALAARLERLAPLSDHERGGLFDDAMKELEPRGQVIPLRRFAPIALAAAAAVAAFFLWPRSSLEWIEAPNADVAADEVVTLALRGSDVAPALFVMDGDAAAPVPMAWDGEAGRWSISVPAHVLSAGRFGDVVLAVAPPGARPEDGEHVRLHIAMPEYAVRGAVAVLSERVRGDDDALVEGAIEVPPGAERLRVTLRPSVAVRSGVTACAFVESEALAPIGDCARFDDGLVILEISAAALEGGRALVVVTSPSALSPSEALDAARTSNVVRVPLR